MREKPTSTLDGLGKGFKSFGMGFAKGVSGVITKPIEGIQEEKSAKGFFKGVGKGVAGLVVKPVSGTVDLISKTAEGIE